MVTIVRQSALSPEDIRLLCLCDDDSDFDDLRDAFGIGAEDEDNLLDDIEAASEDNPW